MDHTTNRTTSSRPAPVAERREESAVSDEAGSQPKRPAPKRAFAVAPKRPTRSEPAKRS